MVKISIFYRTILLKFRYSFKMAPSATLDFEIETIELTELKRILKQAENCLLEEDVAGCCRVLLPIIEYYCLHYEPLPSQVNALLAECSFIDVKNSRTGFKTFDFAPLV